MDEKIERAPSAADSVAMLVVAGGRLLRRELEAKLASIDLTMRHFGALGHLAGTEDLSYSDLARRAGVTTQSMRATVLMLEDRGAVQRTLAGHGHAAKLELTAAGHELLDQARGIVERLDDDLLAGMTADRQRDLKGGLFAFMSGLARQNRPYEP